ncbi:hypothetical protein QUB63_16890 [Microcoleus sp. ARI1-B5]|uniref:hypothetical protein n=1 Tax=unclassified Microcoleus TaxID=2642155 RepID=UPI002FD4AD53
MQVKDSSYRFLGRGRVFVGDSARIVLKRVKGNLRGGFDRAIGCKMAIAQKTQHPAA